MFFTKTLWLILGAGFIGAMCYEDPAEVAVRAVKAVLRTKSRKSPHRSPQAPLLKRFS